MRMYIIMLFCFILENSWLCAQNERPILKYNIAKSINYEDNSNGYFIGKILDLGVNDDKDIYVLDGDEKNIKEIDFSGKIINTFGRSGRGPGEFLHPYKIFINSQNKVIVFDDGNQKISIFSKTGNLLEEKPFSKMVRKFRLDTKNNYIFEELNIKYEKGIQYVKSVLTIYDEKLRLIANIDSSNFYKSKKKYSNIGYVKYPYPSMMKWELIDGNNIIVLNTRKKFANIYNNIGKKIRKIVLNMAQNKLSFHDQQLYFQKELFRQKDRSLDFGAPLEVRKLTIFPKTLPYFQSLLYDPNGYLFIKLDLFNNSQNEYLIIDKNYKERTIELPGYIFNKRTIFKSNDLIVWTPGIIRFPTINIYHLTREPKF